MKKVPTRFVTAPFLQATKALDQAIARDPKFALAHARLAEAWNEMDYADKAKDEMLKVQSLVPNARNWRQRTAFTWKQLMRRLRETMIRHKGYAELARLNPNDPQVYLDLGRAYEKNDQIKEAIKSYVEAATRAPQYATAFLRVGSSTHAKLEDSLAL